MANKKTYETTGLKSIYPSRRRVQLVCPEQSITDQSSAPELSMASVRKKLEKGIISNNFTSDVFYSEQPLRFNNLQDALDFHQQTQREFDSLPVELRKMMGHDIRNLEVFLTDPKNAETLKEYGLLPKTRDGVSEIVNAVNELKTNSANNSNTSPDLQKQPK